MMGEMTSTGPENWFLGARERGNPDTEIDEGRADAWTEGNLARPLVHGAHYFKRLYEEICRSTEGDWVHFTDWRGDADERLAGPGTEIAEVLVEAAARGVHVRGLVWRSHPGAFSEGQNLHLAEKVNAAGGEVLLDERVRRGGSHHQKLFLIRHPGDADRDVAFLGGIDLCHSRNDDEGHAGDPQVYKLDPKYGKQPPWHDAQIEVRGPAIRDLSISFRERWDDPTPLDHRNPIRKMTRRRAHEPDDAPRPLPPMLPDPSPVGPHAIQILRTYPSKRPAFPFAKSGERSIARAYRKAYERARSFIYLEDQYFWSKHVASLLAETLASTPGLRAIVVLPRYPEQDGRFSGPSNRVGQLNAMETVLEAGGDRVAFYDIENAESCPIYVHAKICIVDDVWAAIGSDNVNLRSWTHDSEISCAVIDRTLDEREPTDPAGLGDGARTFARDLRLQLWREHLGASGDEGLIDPEMGFEAWRSRAKALDAWHASGRRGERPPGQARAHTPKADPAWARALSYPLYRTALDPDGRPWSLKRRQDF
jgi:phosphatidylserine/phosphatidylglycerophosphate/cardiolipin synthase-like enzyme